MEVATLKEIETEIKRFMNRLKAAKERLESDSYATYGCKETGALRRSAMDLKNELTKITR